jgi:hypothetical protein
MAYDLDAIVNEKEAVVRDGFFRRIARKAAPYILSAALVAGCNGIGPDPGRVEQCPFNPAVEYVNERGILEDYDVSGFGTHCFWNPVRDADKNHSSFLDPYAHNRTKDMLDWMHELDMDEFYTHEQVQSLVTRFGEGIVNPETRERVVLDTGRVNVDEYLASKDLYEQAKVMYLWAVENEHRADSIVPVHYTNFDAWMVGLFGWPYPEPDFRLPTKNSLIEITGLEPSRGLLDYGPVNWGLSNFGTPDYAPLNFIGKQGELLGIEEWELCNGNVEPGYNSSQNFVPDPLFLSEHHGLNVLVQSMLYSPGTVITRSVATPHGADHLDMTMSVEYPVSATILNIGGYVDGFRLRIVYGHISGEDGNMYDPRLPNVDGIIQPRAVFAWLNSQRYPILGDFQGYVPTEAGIPGPHKPRDPLNTQVDMYIQGISLPQLTAGFNDIRANRHDKQDNYAVAIGNITIFAPCRRKPGPEGEWYHQPQ